MKMINGDGNANPSSMRYLKWIAIAVVPSERATILYQTRISRFSSGEKSLT